ncbi:MAG TPA: DUF1674 domain-containing protein [Wenzhouxiangella sp.]|nr:DUF1674 domain-containing protein [Wenzhouxiangella sp.]
MTKRYNSTSSREEPEGNSPTPADQAPGSAQRTEQMPHPREYGGRKDGLDPTRYGDWEKDGRCIDF